MDQPYINPAPYGIGVDGKPIANPNVGPTLAEAADRVGLGKTTGTPMNGASEKPPVPAPVGPDATPNSLGLTIPNDPNQAAIEKAQKASASGYTDGVPNFDTVNSDTLSSFQTEIDALDKAAAEARDRVTRQYQQIGNVRLGSSRAIQAATGQVGQVTGNALTDELTSKNAQELDAAVAAEQAKYDAQKSALLGQARTISQAEYDRKVAAYTAGADATVKYLQGKTQTAKDNAVTFAKAALSKGIDLSDASHAKDLATYASQLGISSTDLLQIYNDTKTATVAATAKANKDAQTTLSPGQTIVDANGKVIATVSPLDKYQAIKNTDAYGNDYTQIFDSTKGVFVKGGVGVGGSPNSSSGSGSGVGAGIPSANVPVNNSGLPSGIKNPGKNPALSYDQYGLLADTDFNPKNQTDALAQKYLDSYIKNGTVPTASSLGRAIKPVAMGQIDSRARDLYFKATGTALPTPQLIKAQQDIISSNYKLANNLQIQEQTVAANVDLSLKNMTKNGLNSSGFKPLDTLIDNIKNTLQDPNIGQFLAQNSTIQNEVGSLLAVKNASGTTVHDKLASAGIIGNNDSPEVIQQKIKALIAEAGNFSVALQSANAGAYRFTDPLLQDANNPARNQLGTGKVDNALKELTETVSAHIHDFPTREAMQTALHEKFPELTPEQIHAEVYKQIPDRSN